MDETAPALDGIRVAPPCPASWKGMTGDARVRHCAGCRKNVYNLSAMTRREAETLVREREGRLCVRFFRRADGTILTADCPVGLRAVRRRLALLGSALAATFAGLLLGGCARNAGGGSPADPSPTMGKPCLTQPTMGDVADPRPTQGEVETRPAPPR